MSETISSHHIEVPTCWPGFNATSAIELEQLYDGQNIVLQTAAKTADPRTELRIKERGAEPEVILMQEDGLQVAGDPIRLLGTCALRDWHDRRRPRPDNLHYGFIIPGEYLLYDAGKVVRSSSWVKAWHLPVRGLRN